MATDADKLKSEVLGQIRSERFGGIPLLGLWRELQHCRGLAVSREAVQSAVDSLIADGAVYEIDKGEYAVVKPVEPLRPTLVEKIRHGQKSLF